MELGNTSAVTFGGENWLVVAGKESMLPSGEPCVGCNRLRVFSIPELTNPSKQHPETTLVAKASVPLNDEVKSMSMSADGAWLATGGDNAFLFDLTDLNDAKQVLGFLSDDASRCDTINSVGVTPILSSDGSLIAVPTCVESYKKITSVNTYNIDSAGATTMHGSVTTPDGTTRIAMSDDGHWLIVPQSKTDNEVKLYTFGSESKSWTLEYASDAQKIEIPGNATDVSVSVSNFESGTLAVGATIDGDAGNGVILLATIGRDPTQIQDLLVRGSIGKVALSQNGQFLASWETYAGVYDVFNRYVCHTFQTAVYTEIQTPFALSRTGGWFAEATATGVTLYKIHSTANSCTMSQEAHIPLDLVSVVAFGGKDWLAVSATTEDCLGGCKTLRIYNLNDLVGLEAQEHAPEMLDIAV